jgi:hypothetical protein
VKSNLSGEAAYEKFVDQAGKLSANDHKSHPRPNISTRNRKVIARIAIAMPSRFALGRAIVPL